jgi:integrase
MRSRSQKRKALTPPKKTISKTDYGAVRVYTRRHINGCQLKSVADNLCSCPKWIYAKARGEAAHQIAAKTSSFTEACSKAQRILKGFDPEIRAARLTIAQPTPGITIEEAVNSYFASRRVCMKTLESYKAPLRRRPARKQNSGGRAFMNLSLLDYLDRINLTAREPILRMEQLSGEILDNWAMTWKTNDLSSYRYRGIVSTFLNWARRRAHLKTLVEFPERQPVKAGNRCGHFTNQEFDRLRDALPFYRVLHHPEPANYAARLGAFLDLGRWAGMAICDIVRFRPAADLDDNNVLTYRRKKCPTQMAVILLDPAVARRLRSIPPEEGSDPERPLYFPEASDYRNTSKWRERFQNLCTFAGVTVVETEIGERVPPSPHMLRDTFAIDAITRGVSLDNVAKMLGHANTLMTQRSYLQWIKKRIDHCIEDQRAGLARVQVAAPSAAAEVDVPLRATLVH